MLWTLLLAASASAQTIENLHVAAERLLIEAPLPAPVEVLQGEQDRMGGFIEEFVSIPEGLKRVLPSTGPRLLLQLAAVRNAYWRTEASFPLNGKQVVVGFGVSRDKEGYVSVLGEDQEVPHILGITALVRHSQRIMVHGRSYKVSLSPNIFDKLGSRIRIKGGSDSRSFKLRDLINATIGQGFPVKIANREYWIFYLDDLKESGGFGVPDPLKQNISIVRRDGKDFQIFIVPFEDIPTAQIAAYTLYGGDRLGLQLVAGGASLALYPNP